MLVVQKLVERNVTLILIGDSLSSQRLRFIGEDVNRASHNDWSFQIFGKPDKIEGNHLISKMTNKAKNETIGKKSNIFAVIAFICD